jgi:hypothetical protein
MNKLFASKLQAEIFHAWIMKRVSWLHRDFNLHDIISDTKSEQASDFWGRALYNRTRTRKVENDD